MRPLSRHLEKSPCRRCGGRCKVGRSVASSEAPASSLCCPTRRSMKYNVRAFDELTGLDLQMLYALTNDRLRGDVRDDGTRSGSQFRRQLDERTCGEKFPHCWVVLARDRTELVGWCLVTLGPVPEVGFYVDPGRRRHGIGSRLMKKATSLAAKKGAQRLVACPWNSSSQAFYERIGFEIVQRYSTGRVHGVAVIEFVGEKSAINDPRMVLLDHERRQGA